MHILIAEDDNTSRVLLESFLSKYGNCDIASNGREAVEAVARARRRRRGYDLIVMDLRMPVMGGLEAIQEIRKAEAAEGMMRPMKIIVVTGQSDMKSITDALLGKCNAYLMKPIDTRVLASELLELGLAG